MEQKNSDNKIYWIIGIVVIVALAYYFGTRSNRTDNNVSIPTGASSQTQSNSNDDTTGVVGVYDYTQASSHIGQTATVTGHIVEIFTSKSNTTFLDFCSSYKTCPFSVVIFSSDISKFSNVSQYQGRDVSITGFIKSYQGHAEIILNSPDQIKITN